MTTPSDDWLASARRFITTGPECECDCLLCIRGEHHEGCFDDCGYEPNDPKHPTYYERMADAADLARKRAKGE